MNRTILLISTITSFIIIQSCQKDDNEKDDEELNTIKDIDGNNYKTVKIENQIWMTENLKTTKYNDGTVIPNVTDNAEWAALTTGAYCYFNNDSAVNKNKYGILYNWYAVKTGKLCPTGWHVFSDTEWEQLKKLLDMRDKNGNGIYPSPFSGVNGGCRYIDGRFGDIGWYGYWWSSTEFSTTFVCKLHSYIVDLSWGIALKEFGFSVRCLRD